MSVKHENAKISIGCPTTLNIRRNILCFLGQHVYFLEWSQAFFCWISSHYYSG